MSDFFISAHCQTIGDQKLATLEELFGKSPDAIIVDILRQPLVDRFFAADPAKRISLESGREENDSTSFLRRAAMRAFVIEALLNPGNDKLRRLASQIRGLADDLGIDRTLASEAVLAALRAAAGARERHLPGLH